MGPTPQNSAASFLEYFTGLADPNPLCINAVRVVPIKGTSRPAFSGNGFAGVLAVYPQYLLFLSDGNLVARGLTEGFLFPALIGQAVLEKYLSDGGKSLTLQKLAQATHMTATRLEKALRSPQSFFAHRNTLTIFKAKKAVLGGLITAATLTIGMGEQHFWIVTSDRVLETLGIG